MPKTVLACDNIEAVLGAALRGLGLACLPDFLVHEALAERRLQSVLGRQVGAGGQFKALWPSGRHLPARVRAFVDHLAERPM